MHNRWSLIAHAMPSVESEFENFARFLSLTRPRDTIDFVGLPLSRNWPSVSVRGPVINGQLPVDPRRHLLTPPMHALIEVSLPMRENYDVLIGFDPVAVLHGRKTCAKVRVLWGIDFVPTHGNKVLDFFYRRLERQAMRLIDLQIENNQLALAARQTASDVIPPRSMIVPITIDNTIFPRRPNVQIGLRLAFLGSLNERTGADRLLPIVEGLRESGIAASLDIVGAGPMLAEIRRRIVDRNLHEFVTAHGFLKDDRQVAAVLSKCNVGLAPFAGKDGDFTWFADPQKIKFYLAAGLHVVTTDAVPIAPLLENRGAGTALPSRTSVYGWVRHLTTLGQHSYDLGVSQERAKEFAREFERSVAYDHVLREILELLQ